MSRFACLSLVLAILLVIGMIPGMAAAQMVPDTVDPYELAPQNVHLYPISLNARIPYYYLPPIFAPAPMWRCALTADDVKAFAPHNFVPHEIPESTALVAWGTVKKDQRVVLEAANQQEFIVLPPKPQDNGSSYMMIRTEVRYVPRCSDDQLKSLFESELTLEPTRTASIADSLPVEQLLRNYERIEDVADIQPRVHPALNDWLSTSKWPVDRIYTNYSGWRRDPNRVRTLGQYVSPWFTIEGKVLALKRYQGGNYMITVSFEGYNPWYPIEFAKNTMRKILALSFVDYVETQPYYHFEKPMEGKEWFRQGSDDLDPYDTQKHIGTGSPGHGTY
jgi:hypothetical protein